MPSHDAENEEETAAVVPIKSLAAASVARLGDFIMAFLLGGITLKRVLSKWQAFDCNITYA